jgi:hypothetical protein
MIKRAQGQSDVDVLEAWGKVVGVRKKTLEKFLKEMPFREALRHKVHTSLLLDVPAIMEAAVNAAKDGSFNDRKLLLEIAQVYEPRSKTELTGAEGGPIQINIDQVMQMLESRPAAECEVTEVKATLLSAPPRT